MGRALTVLILTVMALAMAMPASGGNPAAAALGPTTWTIMLYMADNASPELPWQGNINQMEAASQTNGTSVIALVDPYGGGNTTMYRVTHDPGGVNTNIVSQIIDDGGAVIPSSTHNANMASSETLSSFIEFSAAQYPADRYVLVLWGHGAGWYGLCPDGTDILTTPELDAALSVATSNVGKSLDLLAVDACAGATLEVLYELRGHVNYFVGSEKDVPSEGLPYRSILDRLYSNVNQTPKELGRMMVEQYISWSRDNSFYSATMTLFEIWSLPSQAITIFTDWFYQWAHMMRWYEGLFHTDLRAAYGEAEHYETDWQVDFGSLGSHLLSATIPEELKLSTRNVLASYEGLIAYFDSYDNPDAVDGIRAREATGAVIYAPSTDFSDQLYSWLDIGFTGWSEFSHMLRRNASSNISDPAPTLHYETEESYGPGLFDTVIVSWPTAYPKIHVSVFRQEASGLVPCGEYNGTGANITIHGGDAIGSLILSTSAGTNKTAEAYARMGPIALVAPVRINVTLNGMIAEGGAVVIRINTSAGVLWINSTDEGNHVIPITLLTPRDVWLGDRIIVNVDADGFVGDAQEWVNSTLVNLTVEMQEKPRSSNGWLLTVGLVALAAVLIAIFALLMRREQKRNA